MRRFVSGMVQLGIAAAATATSKLDGLGGNVDFADNTSIANDFSYN